MLRRDFGDYRYLWVSTALISLTAACGCRLCVRETMPARRQLLAEDDGDNRGGNSGSQWCTCRLQAAASTALRELRDGWRIIRRDRFLALLLAASFPVLASIYGAVYTNGSFLLKTLSYTQSIASLAGIFQPIAMMVGYALGERLTRLRGAIFVYVLGCVCIAAGCCGAGLSAIPTNADGTANFSAQALYWVSWIVTGFGFGFLSPSSLALISARVAQFELGKVMSVYQVVAMLGTLTGSYVWTNQIWVWSETGARSKLGTIYFVSAALQSGVALMISALGARYYREDQRIE